MKYTEYEKALSAARLNKYLYACGGNKKTALQLYKLNIKLCQKMYGILNIFEIVLRNAINDHYKQFFSDPDWIMSQLPENGMLSTVPKKDEDVFLIRRLVNDGKYSSDRVVSSLSFGFLTHLFTKHPFNKGGKSILCIFPNKSKPLGQRAIFNELMRIKGFRNRIAHHEPICFDITGRIDTSYTRENHMLILRYLFFLGYEEAQILFGLDVQPIMILSKIDDLANTNTPQHNILT